MASATPQPAARRFQYGLGALLLFVLVAGPLLAVAIKWFIDKPGPAITSPTSGRVVRANGAPLASGSVTFQGTGSRAFAASGVTKADGTFTLSTFEENDGAVPNNYLVTVVDANGRPLLNASATVKKGNNVFRFTVP